LNLISQETEVELQQLNSNFIIEVQKSDSFSLVHLNDEGQICRLNPVTENAATYE
jgi:hypothetical protein